MDELTSNLFLDRLLGYQDTAALKAAVRLDLFTALARGPSSAAGLAARLNAADRGVRILCDFLTTRGFLSKAGEVYDLAACSRALLGMATPASIAQLADLMADDGLVASFLTCPEETVRRGGGFPGMLLEPEDPLWLNYATTMGPLVAPVVAALAEHVAAWPQPPQRILDVGAAHGLFGIALAQLSSDCEVTALDSAPVLQIARENAHAAGLRGRYHELAGDALQLAWGGPYNLVLMPNFLHHFGEDACVELLKKACRCSAPDGKTLAVEFIPDESRVSPPFPARMAFMMLGATRAGDIYPRSALERMGAQAGFAAVSFVDLTPTTQTLAVFQT
jgi:ubiquinone/menaquinone biosynthesis C-methylase UbiE